MKKEIIIYLVTILISLIMMLVGLFTNIYPVDEGVKPLVSLTVSIFVVFIGERLANYTREENSLKKFEKKLPNHLTQITQFYSLDEALGYLTFNLQRAEVIYNTRIEKLGEKNRKNRASETKYNEAIMNVISKHDVELNEVISLRFENSAKERLNLTNENGTYNVRLINIVPPSFLNFTILDYGNNIKELIIGWATCGLKSEIHQPTFKIDDDRVIEYFQQIFDAMYINGKNLNIEKNAS